MELYHRERYGDFPQELHGVLILFAKLCVDLHYRLNYFTDIHKTKTQREIHKEFLYILCEPL
jgi:hypothetical protein